LRRLASGIIVILLLTSMLTLALNIQPVEASGTIYIRADGSVEPSTANITSADNVTYYFTDNIYDSIVVERDNIVIDGAGYTLQGTGSGTGIDLCPISNGTVKNTKITNFGTGIYYDGWIFGTYGNCTIVGNTLSNNVHGFYCYNSDSHTIIGNNVSNNIQGIHIYDSNNNVLLNNIVSSNTDAGIFLFVTRGNTISANTISNNGVSDESLGGLWISGGGKIFHNNFVDNIPQVWGSGVWDNGYPSGGNYWSDYNGTDLFGSRYQNETGSDGIGDAPYVIDAITDNYPLMKTYAGPHDIGITSVNTSKTIVGEDYSLNIKVKIINYGEQPETFNVTIKANSTTIKTQTVTLTNRNSTTINLTWNTTGWDKGNYTITAKATPIPGETDTADNTFIDGWVVITLPGDVDGDRDVDIYDIVRMAGIYGTTEEDPQYDPNCDIDGDGDIDIYDIVAAAGNYGESW